MPELEEFSEGLKALRKAAVTDPTNCEPYFSADHPGTTVKLEQASRSF